MINKQNIWFVTLFSIILILTIFYISMNEGNIQDFIIDNDEQNEESTLVINEDTELVALKVESNEEELESMDELKKVLLSETSTMTEKSDAYNELLELANKKSDEENIEKILKNEFNLDSFVKITSSNINIVVSSDENSYSLANNIIRRINEEYKNSMYVTVKFN